MADIQTYLDAIENAVYGEDVRGSIHDAIEIINDVGEKVITAGTAVTSPSSSVEGFFDDSLYFNTNTDDLWQCNGTGWTLLGNLKGSQGNPGNPGQAATIAVGTVTKGDNASVVNSGTSSAAVFDFVLPKGDPGPAGASSWGDIDGDIDDQTDLKNALEDVYAQSEELVDRTVGWVCNNLFDIEAVEMGKDIYGEAAANSALFTLNCKPSTRYYLSVHGTNNLQVSYNTTALGPTEVLVASFPYDFLTTEYDTYIKICFTKSGLTKSDIEALQFMLTEVANAPYSEHHPTVEEELADKASISLLDDTVGWDCRNELHVDSSVVSTGIYTVNRNADGEVTSIVANGTLSAQTNLQLITENITFDKAMMVSSSVDDDADDKYFVYAKDTDNRFYFSYNNGIIPANKTIVAVAVVVRANVAVTNKAFYPMLYDASLGVGLPFAPYHAPVSEWGYTREEANVLGAKNRLDIPSSVVSTGIYTVNRNTSGKVTSIVANGTPSTQANLLLSSSITLDKPMILNGCPVGGGDDKYFLYIKNSSAVYLKDYGGGVYLDAGTYTELTIVTRANIAMSNIPFKPMLRLASDPDDTYQPYAMTNRELTEKVVLREHTYTGTSDANGVVVASTVPHHPIVYCYGAPTGGGNVFVEARPGGGGIAFYCHNNGAKVASTEITIHYFDYQD